MIKALKERNRLSIWLIVMANSLVLYATVQADALRVSGLLDALKDYGTTVPVSAAIVASAVLNGLLHPETKARIVYWRWRHALPGHRAFSVYARSDPRVDPAALEHHLGSKLPNDPDEQNRTWYKLYQTVRNRVMIVHVHREFLLLRDYAGLSALFVVFFGAAAIYAMSSRAALLTYLSVLLLQYLLARKSAANAGIRLVADVLVQVTAPSAASPEKPTPAKPTPAKPTPSRARKPRRSAGS
ncbi:hypothetical protein WMF38_54295 [Sorangium sp. So ce118]